MLAAVIFIWVDIFWKDLLKMGWCSCHHAKFSNITLLLKTYYDGSKLTCNTESQKCTLTLVDCLTTDKNNKIKTSVYRKPTFNGLYTRFFSNCSIKFKLIASKPLLICFQLIATPLTFSTQIWKKIFTISLLKILNHTVNKYLLNHSLH